MVAQSYNLIGSVYLRMGEYDKTASIMDKAVAHCYGCFFSL